MIQEITQNKLSYAKILCESDPNINLVNDYLREGQLFAYFYHQIPVSFIVIQQVDNDTIEIKNLLTIDTYRGHGFARQLIQYIENRFQDIPRIIVATANSSMFNMSFYTKLGYHYCYKIDNYFIDNYPQEIYENGIQAIDLMYFEKKRYLFN